MLDSVPDLDLLTYLPQLLDGLMNLLSDPNREIRVAAHKCMMEFLVEIQVRVTWGGQGGGATLTDLPVQCDRVAAPCRATGWCTGGGHALQA